MNVSIKVKVTIGDGFTTGEAGKDLKLFFSNSRTFEVDEHYMPYSTRSLGIRNV